MRSSVKTLRGILAVAGLAASACANIILTSPSQTYTENFNALASSGTGNLWANDSTLSGWFAFRQPSPGTALTTYNADAGSGTSGILISYGSSGNSDRALGSLGSGGAYWGSPSTGNLAGYWGVKIANNTGGALTAFTATYDVEQWRNGGNATQQPLVAEWAIDPTDWFAAFTSGASTLSPIATVTAAALDGNASANRIAGVSFTGSTSWGNGQTLWIRFRELNDVGNDHGLAVDNFSLAVIPEPATVGLLGLIGVAVILRRRLNRAE